MTDKEWLQKLKEVDDKTLIEQLEWFGCDPYYYDLWKPLIKEIERRLIVGKDF